jgi:hypothetical protein
LSRTTGRSGIFQVPIELVRLFAERRQAVLGEQEQEGCPRHAGQLGREPLGQLAGFIELQRQEETGLFFELIRLLLEGLEDLGRVWGS